MNGRVTIERTNSMDRKWCCYPANWFITTDTLTSNNTGRFRNCQYKLSYSTKSYCNCTFPLNWQTYFGFLQTQFKDAKRSVISKVQFADLGEHNGGHKGQEGGHQEGRETHHSDWRHLEFNPSSSRVDGGRTALGPVCIQYAGDASRHRKLAGTPWSSITGKTSERDGNLSNQGRALRTMFW